MPYLPQTLSQSPKNRLQNSHELAGHINNELQKHGCEVNNHQMEQILGMSDEEMLEDTFRRVMKDIKKNMDPHTLDSSFIPITFECMLNHLSSQANRKYIMKTIIEAKNVEEQIANYIKLIHSTIEECDTPGSQKIMNVVKMRLESAKRK